MDKDTKLIFEAYKQTVLNEAPPSYAPGDLELTKDIETAAGGAYGIGKRATEQNKSKTEIASSLLKKIQATLFKPEPHVVDGQEYKLYYPKNEMNLKKDLIEIIQQELGIKKSLATYTARIIKNFSNIVTKDVTAGGLVARPEAVKKAVVAGLEGKPVEPTPVTKKTETETVYEIDKSVALADKALKSLVIKLPDEDVHETEILSVLKQAISEYNDQPGIEPIKIKSFDLLDRLKEVGVLKEKQVEKETPEGEGSGEVATMDDYPETDDVGSVARELGMIGRGRGYDAGGFSYGD